MIASITTALSRFSRILPCTAGACLGGLPLALGAAPLPVLFTVPLEVALGLAACAGLLGPVAGFVADALRHLWIDIALGRALARGDRARAIALERAFMGM